jgi:hypothetical protein
VEQALHMSPVSIVWLIQEYYVPLDGHGDCEALKDLSLGDYTARLYTSSELT